MNIEVDIDITCSVCGKRLDWSQVRHSNDLNIEPCGYCIDEAKEKAYSEGVEEGRSENE